ncbi:hypothetical protein HK105_203171 [Polyrhizophydium stewartii]|uniref:Uncharacterized protein n=1 Tax=Polyrhizophydium stewartii TaxID=2732419 RepID=A0ABR4NC56_9FUNG
MPRSDPQEASALRASRLNLGRMSVIMLYMLSLLASYIPGGIVHLSKGVFTWRLLVGVVLVFVFARFSRSHGLLNNLGVGLFVIFQIATINLNLNNAFGRLCDKGLDPSCDDDIASGHLVPRRVASAALDVSLCGSAPSRCVSSDACAMPFARPPALSSGKSVLTVMLVLFEIGRQTALRSASKGTRLATNDMQPDAQMDAHA